MPREPKLCKSSSVWGWRRIRTCSMASKSRRSLMLTSRPRSRNLTERSWKRNVRCAGINKIKAFWSRRNSPSSTPTPPWISTDSMKQAIKSFSSVWKRQARASFRITISSCHSSSKSIRNGWADNSHPSVWNLPKINQRQSMSCPSARLSPWPPPPTSSLVTRRARSTAAESSHRSVSYRSATIMTWVWMIMESIPSQPTSLRSPKITKLTDREETLQTPTLSSPSTRSTVSSSRKTS